MDYFLDFVRTGFEQHTHVLLFATIFLEQIGLPVPAYPSLIVAGALSATGIAAGFPCQVLGMAVCACLAADMVWYWLGLRFGSTLTRRVCHLAMSPEACVTRSAAFYNRYGPRMLLIAKFLPGAGAMSTLLAGTNGTSLRRFMAYDAMGSLLWAGSALALGYTFHDTVSRVMKCLAPFTYIAVGAAVLIAFLLMAARWRSWHAARTATTRMPSRNVLVLWQAQPDDEA
ncbi:DedA family protein [Parapusillimonas sp. SGNA-6]|nr:DedA family protein [Parapusillimonas sp. SGNA-6]